MHFDGWGSWASQIPVYLLPAAYASHATSFKWAQDMERMLLRELKAHTATLGHSLREDLRLSHAHVLDQSKVGATFKWHRDTEEQGAGRRILWSMVVLLRFDGNGRAASMKIAGAVDVGKYDAAGAFHVFDAGLYHSTVASSNGGVKLGLFFACPW